MDWGGHDNYFGVGSFYLVTYCRCGCVFITVIIDIRIEVLEQMFDGFDNYGELRFPLIVAATLLR